MNPTENFDVIIIDAGPPGIFCARELTRKKPDMKILIVEKRRSIEKRVRLKHTAKVCVGCKPCSITTGFMGAGAFSDRRLSLSPDTGGNLPEVLGYGRIIELLRESDNIYLKFGTGTDVYDLDRQKEIEEIYHKAINADLKLIECPIRHLGMEEGYKICTHLQEHLLTQGVTMEFNTMVKDIITEEDRVKGALTDKNETYYAPEIVSAIGRKGSDRFSHICGGYGIETQVSTVDIGVRVGVGDKIMKFLNDNLYEAKLIYCTPTFGDKIRTSCTDPSGEAATEYYENGLAVVDGHACKSKEYKTNNTNLALLVSKNFTKSFNEPTEYGRYIAQLSNMLCDDQTMVQTFGNFQRGRRTTEERLCRNNLIPTLKDAVPGDLSLMLPHRIMIDIKGMLLVFDKMTPGIASDETLLYGVEVRSYSNKVVVNTDLETSTKGLRAIGDGVSVARGLQRAFANGISVARSVLK